MTCREFIDFIAGYGEGTLPAAQQAHFDEHLDECPDCVSYLETFNKTVALTAAACTDDDAIPADVPEDLVKAVLKARNAPPPELEQ